MPIAPLPFTLRQLQYVVAVADRRSFRRAAEDCRVAQPSLSTQVAEVEAQIGVRLFERDPRAVRPTAEGAAFVERARALLVAAAELRDQATSMRDPLRRTVRVGVIPTVGPYLLPDVGPALRKAHPHLGVLWTEEKTAVLLERLHGGELDGAILADGPELSDLATLPLGKDPFVFAAAKGHPLAHGKKPLEPSALDGERVLLLDDGHCFRTQALSFCARAGAEEAGYRATSLQTLVQMAAAGDAVTLLPSLAVPFENRRGPLAVRPFGPRGPSRTLVLAHRPTSAARVALEAIARVGRQAVER